MNENLQLVTPSDKNLITDSEIVARVFGKEHFHVLRAIEDLIVRNAEVYKSNFGFIPTQTDLAKGLAEEHQRRSALMIEGKGEKQDRRREFGDGAGKLIGEPIRTIPPTEYDMLLAQAYDKIWEQERNTIDSSKRQYFRKVETTVDLQQGRTRKSHKYEMNRRGFLQLALGFTGEKAHMFREMFLDEFERLESAVLEQLLIDSQQLHLIEDRSRWQDMEYQIRGLNAEKRELQNQLILLDKKGKNYHAAYRAIRKEAVQDAAKMFYKNGRAALGAATKAKLSVDVDHLQHRMRYIEDMLYGAMDQTVDITNSYGLDLEAMFDEDEISRLESNLFKSLQLCKT